MTFKREKGQGLVEYALLLVLVAVVVIGILALVGPQINAVFSRVITELGGTVPYTYSITSGPTITAASSAGPSCTYRLTMSVRVTDGGTAVDGASVNATVSGGPATGSPPAKTTDASGVATWTNATIKVVSGACQSGSSTINVAGGAASGSASY